VNTVTITGHSDDCIEVEGAIREEFYALDEWAYLHFNGGTIVKVGYALVPEKGWHVEVVRLGGGVTAKQLEPILEDGDHYRDRLKLTGGGLCSVKCWGSEDGPTGGDMEAFWDGFDQRDYSDKQLVAAYHALQEDKS